QRREAVRGAGAPARGGPHRRRQHPRPQPVPRLGDGPSRLGGRAGHPRPDPAQPPALLTFPRPPSPALEKGAVVPAEIVGLGVAVPPSVLTNADLEELVDTNDQWITERTGIKERRVAGKDDSTA